MLKKKNHTDTLCSNIGMQMLFSCQNQLRQPLKKAIGNLLKAIKTLIFYDPET